jgi:hypothetical protein
MGALCVPIVLLGIAAALVRPTFASATQAVQTQSSAGQGNVQAPPTAAQPNPQTGTSPHPRAQSQKKPEQPAVQAPAQSITLPAPVAPPPPNWPANNPPAPASVLWDSRGLSVTASNSSLAQILRDVSVDTGVKIEGFASDERMFGTYGPGPAGDVLSELLDGTNYDVLIVGHQGTPQRIVLTPHSNAPAGNNNANPAAPSEEDNAVEEESQQPPMEQPPPPPPPQAAPSPNAPDVPVRTQQQLIQEMQERERQLEQQRQQQPNPQQ